MGHQTKVSETNGSPKTPSKGLAGDVGGFAHDVLTLAELQAQLFLADARECGQRVLVPGFVLVCGAVLGLACLPIALAALALLLVQVYEISYAAGFLITVVVGMVTSAVLGVVGWLQLREHATVLKRSQQELVRNLRWIKKVLKRDRITRENSIDESWRTMT